VTPVLDNDQLGNWSHEVKKLAIGRAWGETQKSAEFWLFPPQVFFQNLPLISSRMPCGYHSKGTDCDACDKCQRCPNPACEAKHGTGERKAGRPRAPSTQEERDKRKVLELAALGGPRTQPVRATVTALHPESYVDDSHDLKDAWSHLQSAFVELGMPLPDTMLEIRPMFTSEQLTDANLDKALSLVKRFVEAGARLVTSDQEASAVLVAAYEAAICYGKKNTTPDLLPRACTMILTVKDKDHRRVLRALCAELPDEAVKVALEEAWDKLSPEDQNRVRAEGVELRKPQLSMEGEAISTDPLPTAAALKRKRTEDETRCAFSRRNHENGQRDFAQLTNGAELEVTRMTKSRIAEQTMFDALNFVIGRGVLRAGHTQVASAGRAFIGPMAYYEVNISAKKLFAQYYQAPHQASGTRMGRRTFQKLFDAVAKQTTQISCLSPPYMRNANAFKIFKELLGRLEQIVVECHGQNEPTGDSWEEYLGLKASPKQLSARLDALKEHLSSKTFCSHVCSLEHDTPSGTSPESCDHDAAHCARFATDIGCPGTHSYKCVACAETFLLPPLVWKMTQAVRNSLSRQFPHDQRFALIASAKASSDGWTLPLPAGPRASQTQQVRAKKTTPPALASRLVHLLGAASPPFKAVEELVDAFVTAWPNGEPVPSRNMIKKVLHTVGAKEKREGDLVHFWYARKEDATPPPPHPPSPPPIESTTTTTTTMPFLLPHSVAGAVAGELLDMMAAVKASTEAIREYVAHMVRGQIQTAAEKHMISLTNATTCVINVDYKNKQNPLSHREAQTDYFGKRGLDLQGAVFIFKGQDGKIEHQFVDLIPTTSDHTIELMVATLEPLIEYASSLGFRTVDVWSDGASNYKSLALIPLLVQANRDRWGCNVHVRSWNYSEAGDGKGPVDVHFALSNRWLKASIDGGRNVTTPREYYVSAGALPYSIY